MDTVTATFSIPDAIDQGLKNGNYVRFGGVIRDAQTKQVVAMLREVAPNLTQGTTILSQLGSVASILNLGVSVIGFAIVIKHLGEIEQRLKQVQEDIKQLHHKFDLSVYANFRAALDLARNTLTMKKPEHRTISAMQSINRLLEFQHIFTVQVDKLLNDNIQLSNQDVQLSDENDLFFITSITNMITRVPDIEIRQQYLLTLFLSYIAEARCYLELEEIETANLRLQEGAEVLHQRVDRYYGTIDNFIYNFYKKSSEISQGKIITEGIKKTFLPFLSSDITLKDVYFLSQSFDHREQKRQINEQKLQIREQTKTIVETYERFQAYQAEIQAISQLGISFHDWLKLTPPEIKPDEAELMYIIPSKPLDLAMS